MGQMLRKLDIIALTASKSAADKLAEFLQNAKADIVSAIAGDTIYHQGTLDGDTTTLADATVLASVIALANELKGLLNTHLPSTGNGGVHRAASAEEITSPDADDQASANLLLNEMKADYNTHLSESGVHVNDDTTNTVTAANATDLGTSVTLVNDIKAVYNAHVIVSISMGFIQS